MRLLIDDALWRTLHAGTQLTLAHLCQAYWIIGGRTPVKAFFQLTNILQCVVWARQKGIHVR